MTGNPLSSEVREVGGVTIVTLRGKLHLGEATRGVSGAVKNLVEEGRRAVVLELREVISIDSSGLGTLMSCYTSLRNAGGQLKLLGLSRRVHDQLLMTKLLPIFEVFDDETAAAASFNGA